MVLPTFIAFILVILIVVLIHELGHFTVAKLIGVKVEEFGFGYPPRLFGKKIGETLYSINALPFGGFVRLFGEQEAQAEGTKSNRAFFNKSVLQRSLVILAGVFMNLVLGCALFSLVYSVSGIPEESDFVVIEGAAPGSPADQAGLRSGDRILAVDGQGMAKVSEFVEYMQDKGGEAVALTVGREDGSTRMVEVTPRENPPEGEGAIGVSVSNVINVFYPAWQMPFRGAWVGIQETYAWTKEMVKGLGQIVTGLFAGQAPEVAGVVQIYQITGVVAEQGVLPLIKFIGVFSINLAVINIIPFPALDGGRFAFIMIEKFIGRKIKPQIEAYINAAGMVVLIALMILVTVADVMRLVRGG